MYKLFTVQIIIYSTIVYNAELQVCSSFVQDCLNHLPKPGMHFGKIANLNKIILESMNNHSILLLLLSTTEIKIMCATTRWEKIASIT